VKTAPASSALPAENLPGPAEKAFQRRQRKKLFSAGAEKAFFGRLFFFPPDLV
jgi:hypothetical protein